MNYEEIIERIEDILEDGKTSVIGGKKKVDSEAIRQCLDELSSSIPTEIIQARKIVADRRDILTRAQEAASKIIADAQTQAKRLVEVNEITIAAQDEGKRIVSEAKDRANEIATDAANKANELIRATKEQNAEETAAAEKWKKELEASASNFVMQIMGECEEYIQNDLNHYRESLDIVHSVQAKLNKSLSKKFEDYSDAE